MDFENNTGKVINSILTEGENPCRFHRSTKSADLHNPSDEKIPPFEVSIDVAIANALFKVCNTILFGTAATLLNLSILERIIMAIFLVAFPTEIFTIRAVVFLVESIGMELAPSYIGSNEACLSPAQIQGGNKSFWTAKVREFQRIRRRDTITLGA